MLTLNHLLQDAYQEDEERSPCPSDHFDLICGVGSGALIAILYGRLGMRCDEALAVYERLGRLVFREKHEGASRVAELRGPDRRRFEQELKKIVREYLGHENAPMRTSRNTTTAMGRRT